MDKNILFKTVNSNGIYSCDELDITVEDWKTVLQDSSIYDNYKLWLARFYQEPEHKASCKFMGEKYKCSYQTPNSVIIKFGIASKKVLNRFEVQGTDGGKTYWVIPMKQGKYVDGHFEWTMRDELVQAMEELGMTDAGKYENHIFQEIYDNSLISLEEDYKSGWANKYNEIIRIVKENVENNVWTDECKYLVLKSSNNGISGINWGLSNDEYDKILNNWEEFESIFNNIARAKIISKEEYNKIIGMIKNLTGKNYELIVNRVIGALLPGVVSTFPKAEIFYEHLTFVKEKFPDLPEITNDWLTDNLNFFKFCKAKVKFQDENHISGFLGVLSKYCKDKTSQGDSQMENLQDKLINETKNLLENTKNLILTGAPGTGKTYLAKQIAEKMGCEKENIGFVQFHQSYDYTDFVEGLRPVQNDGNNQIGFERKDGVFKEFCAKALKNLVDSRKSESELDSDNIFKIIYEMFINDIEDGICNTYPTQKGDFAVSVLDNGNLIFEQNSPRKKNVRKDYLEILFNAIKDFESLNLQNISRDELDKIVKENIKTISHIDYIQYRWTLFQLVTRYKKVKNEIIVKKTESIPLKPFVFIIDEINRGEVSKIFGELFYSVDPGYRVTAEDLEKAKSGEKSITSIRTQYANLEIDGNDFDRELNTSIYGHFFIPENVYIIGTMNDIDRSVESMDFAFRRRFAWKEITANDTQYMLDEVEKDGVIYGLPSEIAEEAKERMNRLNEEISKVPELNSAYHIGASYFLKLKNYESDSDNGFQNLWNYHLKGILEEYLRGNPAKNDLMKTLKAAYDGEVVTNEG